MEKRGPGQPPIGPAVRVPVPEDVRNWIRAEARRQDRPYARVVRELIMAGIAAKQAEAQK
jgi:hypothetical protein